jgi:uncharacterized protein with von Willebrand factor type A (vWA) domain
MIQEPSENDREKSLLARVPARSRTGSERYQDQEQDLQPNVSQSVATPALRAALERARSVLQRNTTDLQPELPTPAPEATAETRRPPAAAPWTDWEMNILINHRLREAINSGHPPRNTRAWRSATRHDELANEAAHPGWIRRCAAGIQAHQQGKRITGWRWQRGTHSGRYVRDPYGTDEPPRGTT